MAFTKIPAATNRTVNFTSSGTFTVPSGVFSAEFLVVGAGGGGGGTSNSAATRGSAGGGGGGGAVKYVTFATTPGTAYTITIGAGGTGVSQDRGNNGGITEVILSGTTLIKCGGGVGGEGIQSDALTGFAEPALPAGAGGKSQTSTNATVVAGGGGSSADYSTAGYTGGSNRGEGSRGGVASAGENFGKLGFNGFGNGGAGGRSSTGTLTANSGQAGFGGGIGATAASVVSATVIAGGNATIAGGGGGGSITALATTAAAGGNGADGLVRITYFG